MCTIGLHTATSYCSILYKTIKYKQDDHYLSSEIEINKVTYSHATFLFKWWNFIALILFKLYYLDLCYKVHVKSWWWKVWKHDAHALYFISDTGIARINALYTGETGCSVNISGIQHPGQCPVSPLKVRGNPSSIIPLLPSFTTWGWNKYSF